VEALMSVLETDVIDYIYLDQDHETPVLVVSDPLGWRPPDDERHLDALREKFESQIAFIESGQIRKVWPRFDGRPVRVEVVARSPLTGRAHAFYAEARHAMSQVNMELRFQLLDA
jgi:hypothetical protein